MKTTDFEIRYIFVKYRGSDGYIFDIYRGNIRFSKVASYCSIDDYALDLKKHRKDVHIPIFHHFFVKFPFNFDIIKSFEEDLKRYPKLFDTL